MKNKFFKLLILVFCVSVALFAISCKKNNESKESVRESVAASNSESLDRSEESSSFLESESATESESTSERQVLSFVYLSIFTCFSLSSKL